MTDLTLCIYDELVVEGSIEHKMLKGVWAGEKTIVIFGIEYVVTNIESTKYNRFEKYSRNAMNKTMITAARLIPMVYP